MADALFFGYLHDATGCRKDVLPGHTVGELIEEARHRYGDRFNEVFDSTCRVWVNGEPSTRETEVADNDEVAFLPPVSGG